jgi:hypothetical protein
VWTMDTRKSEFNVCARVVLRVLVGEKRERGHTVARSTRETITSLTTITTTTISTNNIYIQDTTTDRYTYCNF